jgi:hypothetical protein
VLYEIHLFGALADWTALALRWSGPAARATVFGLLLASALLVRSENAAVVFGVTWLGYELWRRREGAGPSWRRLAAATAIPLVSLAALIGLVSWRNGVEGTVFSQLRHKHEVNLCEVYAIGLFESGDVRVQNPAGQCTVYTREDFGQPFPSLTEAIAENPGAIAEHFARNAELIPAGLELGLFNARFGSASESSNPDYVLSTGAVDRARRLIAVLLVIARRGADLTERRRWWRIDPQPTWGWIAPAAMGRRPSTQRCTRQRPSYLFP